MTLAQCTLVMVIGVPIIMAVCAWAIFCLAAVVAIFKMIAIGALGYIFSEPEPIFKLMMIAVVFPLLLISIVGHEWSAQKS
ncbi:MAG: hypothetical protein WC813_03985 [Patescibacteria group bacterium]